VGAITIAKIREAKSTKKAIKLPTTIKVVTGTSTARKEVSRQTAFCEVGWGALTRSYMRSLQKLTDIELGKIMDEAKTFSKASRREEVADEADLDDERADLDIGLGSFSDDDVDMVD
jgi:hypothetical protein